MDHTKTFKQDLFYLNKLRDTDGDVSMSIEISGNLTKGQKALVTKTFQNLKKELKSITIIRLIVRTDKDFTTAKKMKFAALTMSAQSYKHLLGISPGTSEQVFCAFERAYEKLSSIPQRKSLHTFSESVRKILDQEYNRIAVTESLKNGNFITNSFVKKLQEEGMKTNHTVSQDVWGYLEKCQKEGIRIEATAEEMIDLAVYISPDDWREAV